MKEVAMDLADISESRELMEAKPYPMVVYFTYVLMGILTTMLVWASFGEIDIVVKGTGTIRPENSISAVTNKVTGRVDQMCVVEGAKVQKWDLLYTIEHSDLDATEALVNQEIQVKDQEVQYLTKYKDSILKGQNLFDVNNPNENPYYYKYQTLAEERGVTQGTLEGLKNEAAGLTAYKRAIETGALKLEGYGEYSLKYQSYQLKKTELSKQVAELEKQYQIQTTLHESGSVSDQVVQNARIEAEKAQSELSQFQSNTISDVAATISQKQLEVKKLEALKGQTSGDELLPVETQGIVQADEKMGVLNEDLRALKEQLIKVNYEIEKCTLKAEVTGTVNLKTRIASGDFVNSGVLVATVIPDSKVLYKVQIVMPQKEIAGIRVGDTIKYRFQALPYQEYGALNGKVSKISEDASIDEKQGVSYYVVEADIENKPLYSYKGKKAELKVGMTCEAQVVTKSKRILSFLLEKLNLWD